MCILFFETFKIGHFQHIKSQHLLLFECFSILVCIKTTFENESHLCFSCLWKSNKRNTSRKQHLSQDKDGIMTMQILNGCFARTGLSLIPRMSYGTEEPKAPPSLWSSWAPAQWEHIHSILLPQLPPPGWAFHAGIKPQLEAIISRTLGKPTEAVITW